MDSIFGVINCLPLPHSPSLSLVPSILNPEAKSSDPMTSSLAFTVRRRDPELVAPAESTPHEFKALSDFDEEPNNRGNIWSLYFYRNNPSISMERHNPSSVIREALAKVLTFYYPLAGRLREGAGGRLVVECTGQGVMFVEANADVRLEQFGDDPRPPFPCLEELLYEAEGYSLLDSPLLLFQVTQLRCGGFVFACRFNHTIADGPGLAQFMKALVEMVRGADAPTVLPVWERELLKARTPPRVTHEHPELEMAVPPDTPIPPPPADMVLRSFFIGPSEMSALRRRLPAHRRSTSTRFEVLTACVWRCRTIALGYDDPAEQVRVMLIFNARGKSNGLPLPAGFYGNAFVRPVSRSTAGELCGKPLGYALERVREAKASVTQGYFQSWVDAGVLHERPLLSTTTTDALVVTDTKRAGFHEVDFGWGRPVYAGLAHAGRGLPPLVNCSFVSHRNNTGEEGILLIIHLRAPAMDRFAKEMEDMTKDSPDPS